LQRFESEEPGHFRFWPKANLAKILSQIGASAFPISNFAFHEFVKSKFFLAPSGKSVAALRPARASKRGRNAIVTERWRGLRWTLAGVSARKLVRTNAGSVRQSRVVLAPRPWRQADGAIQRRRWQKRPLTGESTKETVKPLRGESRDCLAEPVVTTLVCFFHLQTRLRVQLAPGFPCAL